MLSLSIQVGSPILFVRSAFGKPRQTQASKQGRCEIRGLRLTAVYSLNGHDEAYEPIANAESTSREFSVVK